LTAHDGTKGAALRSCVAAAVKFSKELHSAAIAHFQRLQELRKFVETKAAAKRAALKRLRGQNLTKNFKFS